jgi:NAD(P)H-flavin reductase
VETIGGNTASLSSGNPLDRHQCIFMARLRLVIARIQVSQPAGDFVLSQDSSKTLVSISSGVGVTPILCMLNSFVQMKGRKAIWVHGA